MPDHTPLTEEELASMEEWAIEHGPLHVFRLIADLRAARAEVERMAETLWAIYDGDGSGQDRIIAAGGLGDRFDHSKPHGRAEHPIPESHLMTDGGRWPPLSDNQLEAASLSRTPIVQRLIADLRASRAINAELTQAVRLADQEADEVIAELRAENAELERIAVDATKKAARLTLCRDELAMALHQCSGFLPIFIEEGPKLKRARAANDRTNAALKAYCDAVGISRQELHRRTAGEA